LVAVAELAEERTEKKNDYKTIKLHTEFHFGTSHAARSEQYANDIRIPGNVLGTLRLD
jgi:hypothetical protein